MQKLTSKNVVYQICRTEKMMTCCGKAVIRKQISVVTFNILVTEMKPMLLVIQR